MKDHCKPLSFGKGFSTDRAANYALAVYRVSEAFWNCFEKLGVAYSPDWNFPGYFINRMAKDAGDNFAGM